ncbi:hypothetical protein KY328_03480, partial [Candidatus Woesearchaeota archaeon]|nr:hypothetical protein [Candidatus Woesearchaeota archaeon]
KGKMVLVETVDGKKFKGKLAAFDLYLNIVLEDVELEDGTKKDWVFLKSLYGFVVV